MRECRWHSKDESVQVPSAIRTLSEFYDGIQQDEIQQYVRYKDILYPEDGSNPEPIGVKLYNFITNDNVVKTSLNPSPDPEFQHHFRFLKGILEGEEASRKLSDEARLGLFPWRIQPIAQYANWVIVYASIPIYCLARLSIMAVAFSSLRLMPESVYSTTWTGVIPNWA
jgi:hypothetical protein